MKNFEFIKEAINFINNGEYDLAVTRLKAFTEVNTQQVKGGKLNIWNWVSKDKLRQNLQGVFYDVEKKVAVATDTHVLIVSDPDYIEPADGVSKTIRKNGEIVEERFPNYERVFPKLDFEIEVNVKNVSDMLTKVRSERKLDKNVECLALNVSSTPACPVYLAPKYCMLLLTLPEGKFYYKEASDVRFAPILYVSNNGFYRALFMPTIVDEDKIGQPIIMRV